MWKPSTFLPWANVNFLTMLWIFVFFEPTEDTASDCAEISTAKWKSMEEETFHANKAPLHFLNHDKNHAVATMTSRTVSENGVTHNVNSINIIDEEIVVQVSNQTPSTSDNFYGVVWIWIIYRWKFILKQLNRVKLVETWNQAIVARSAFNKKTRWKALLFVSTESRHFRYFQFSRDSEISVRVVTTPSCYSLRFPMKIHPQHNLYDDFFEFIYFSTL